MTLFGEEVSGSICLDIGTCVDEFPFLYLINPTNRIFNEKIAGVVGLARPRKFALDPEQKVDKSKLIMEAVTEASVFTFSFDSLQEPVSIGGIGGDTITPSTSDAETTITEDDGAASVQVNKDFFWST